MTLITAARRRTAEVIELHKRREYAVFTIDDNPDRGYFGLGIESSYGGFAFAWSHPGRSFREFLAQLNLGYVLSKMVCPAESEFDGEETELACVHTGRRTKIPCASVVTVTARFPEERLWFVSTRSRMSSCRSQPLSGC